MNPAPIIRIEDELEDVLAKAGRGLGIPGSELHARAGCSRAEFKQLISGEEPPSRDLLEKLAGVLELSAQGLMWLAATPSPPGIYLPDWLIPLNSPCPVPGYAEMTVNSFMIESGTDNGVLLVDTGMSVGPGLEILRKRERSLCGIFLTHAHRDHIACLADWLHHFPGIPVWLDCREDLDRQEFSVVDPPREFDWGGRSFEVRSTPGHSPGGATLVVNGGPETVAFVGDALFCGSVGGAATSVWKSALEAIRTQILSLSPDCIVCPGHGPLTTVRQEQMHNAVVGR